MYLSDIENSIARILSTPLGSRVMEPSFGSDLHLLVDRRIDESWRLYFIKYVSEAIANWEPRVELQRVVPRVVGEQVKIELELFVIEENEKVFMEIDYDRAA
jgi:phage baseplate assembly protein W